MTWTVSQLFNQLRSWIFLLIRFHRRNVIIIESLSRCKYFTRTKVIPWWNSEQKFFFQFFEKEVTHVFPCKNAYFYAWFIAICYFYSIFHSVQNSNVFIMPIWRRNRTTYRTTDNSVLITPVSVCTHIAHPFIWFLILLFFSTRFIRALHCLPQSTKCSHRSHHSIRTLVHSSFSFVSFRYVHTTRSETDSVIRLNQYWNSLSYVQFVSLFHRRFDSRRWCVFVRAVECTE